MAFTAKDVQNLREMTGVGMMECKKALTESEGDIDKAIELLRERGLAAAAKKAGRVAAEGVCYAFVDKNGDGIVIEVNSETDFVAKNEDFVGFVKDLAFVVSEQAPADVDALKALPYPGSDSLVEQVLQDKVLTIGENIQIRRFERVLGGFNDSYIHIGGSIGVICNFNVEGISNVDALRETAHKVCLQIAAMKPQFANRREVPADIVEKEKAILAAQIQNDPKLAGKPAPVIAKMVEGRIGKFFEDACLEDQEIVVVQDVDKLTVGKYLEAKGKELGGTIKINRFVCFVRGEGIEKREDNFAEEVAKMTGK